MERSLTTMKNLFVIGIVAIVLVFGCFPHLLAAQEVPAAWTTVLTPKHLSSPPRVVEGSGVVPAIEMPAADTTIVQPIIDWNLGGHLPLRNGIERVVPHAVRVVIPRKASGTKVEFVDGGVLARSAADDATVWGSSFRVEDAWRMRLRLSEVRLPEQAQIWVYGDDGETVGPFGTELIGPDGTLWTPSVGGPEIRFEVSVPDAARPTTIEPSLTIEGIAELFRLSDAGVPQLKSELLLQDTSCLVDAACVETSDWPPIDIVTAAVALLYFQDGGGSYFCTGSLVNDSDPSTWIPYLLTANHCFATQSAATTMDAFFDYIPSSCGGDPPNPATLPRTYGSTLLETSTTSDFTFVRLNQVPSGYRGFLGWTTVAPPDGEPAARVSFPNGQSESFTEYAIDTSPPATCGYQLANFHFDHFLSGGTFGGSSGGALINTDGQIMGQLKGACGPHPENGCDYSNYDFDGKFSVTFPYVEQYLLSQGSGDCVQDLDNGVVCLRNGRFELTGTWTDFANPPNTNPLIWTPVEDINATAGFQNNPTGIQIVMRVADGCQLTGTWWVWLGGFTDAGWDITVRDTVTGQQRNFSKPRQAGEFPTTTRDTATFTCD